MSDRVGEWTSVNDDENESTQSHNYKIKTDFPPQTDSQDLK